MNPSINPSPPVLRIHDILVWIRIRMRIWMRIRGSMPLTNGSGCGSGSFYFHNWPSRCQPKSNFFNKVFPNITFRRYFYIIFQRWKVKKKSQNSRNQGFPYYFCLIKEGSRPGSGSIHLTNGSGSGSRGPKNAWIRWIRIRNTASPYRNIRPIHQSTTG